MYSESGGLRGCHFPIVSFIVIDRVTHTLPTTTIQFVGSALPQQNKSCSSSTKQGLHTMLYSRITNKRSAY